MPPHDEAAEEAVLGSLLIDSEAVFTVSTQLKTEDFFVPRNKLVYEACMSLYARTDEKGKSQAINQVTVAQELARRNLLAEAGGASHLAHVVSTVPTSLHAEYYSQIVSRLAVMRSLIGAAGQISRIGYEAGPDPDVALGQAEDILFQLRRGRIARDFVPMRQVLDDYLEQGGVSSRDRSGHLQHITTGFHALDELLGGFQRSDLIIIGARPSMGKTSLGLAVARNAVMAENPACVAFFSMEMSRESVVNRFISSESDVDSHRLRLGQLTGAEEKRVMDSIGTLAEAPFYIDDSPQLRVVEMRSKVRRLHNERGVDMVMLDYLQLVQGDTRNANRVQEVSDITRSLKALARELNVPVVVVSQLSRALMGRGGTHRPQLSDLRESGSIEQDADVVMFIHREDYYSTPEEWSRDHDLSKEPYPRGIADLIVAKHRNGPVGEVKLRFQGRTAWFYNMEVEEAA